MTYSHCVRNVRTLSSERHFREGFLLMYSRCYVFGAGHLGTNVSWRDGGTLPVRARHA